MSLDINMMVASEHRDQLIREAAAWRRGRAAVAGRRGRGFAAWRQGRGAQRAAATGRVATPVAPAVYCNRAAAFNVCRASDLRGAS